MSDDSDYSWSGDESDDESEIVNERTQQENDEYNILDPEFNDDVLDLYNEHIDQLFQTNKITDYTYQIQLLTIKHKQLILHNTFDINKENQIILDKLKDFQDKYQKDFLDEKIDEETFNKQEYKYLKQKIKTLEECKSIESNRNSITFNEDDNIDTRLDEFIKKEESHLKQVAKKNNIYWPEKLKITEKMKSDLSNDKIIEMKENYELELNKAQNEAKKHTSGLIKEPLQSDRYSQQDKYIEIKSNKTIKEIINQDNENQVIVVDPAYKLIIDNLKSKLKNMSREALLNCIDIHNIKFSDKTSYIEKLQTNTVPIMKFIEYPETVLKLQNILLDEAKYYKVSDTLLLENDFVNTFSEDELETSNKQFNITKQVKINGKLIDTEGSFLLKTKETLKNKNANRKKYKQNGSILSLSFNNEYFKQKNSYEILDEKHFDIIKPISDDLYNELQEKNVLNNGKQTKILRVWELHITVSGIKNKIIRRYNLFTDYLNDLIQILYENMIIFEKNKNIISADILHKKIKKIDYFLKEGKDGEYEIEGKYSVTDYIKQNPTIIIQRENGSILLSKYILDFYPDNIELIAILENDIFNYSNKNYYDNIHKILFIFKNYSNTLSNYILGNLSFIEIINTEIPFNIIDEKDLDEQYTNPEKTLDNLKNWKPESSEYLKYKDKLELVDDDLIQFTEDNLELSNLEIKNIIFEMNDYKKWEKSIIDYNLHSFKNINDKIIFLRKERNKLLCRIIFRVTNIKDRLQTRLNLFNKYSKCNIQTEHIDNLADITENIIYTYSKKPKDYKIYSELIINTAPLICDKITDYNNVIPIITEFIIKEGNLNLINIKKIESILLNKKQNIILLNYLQTLRESELEIYRNALMIQENKKQEGYKYILIKAINTIISQNKQIKRDYMYLIADNTFIIPVETQIKPILNNGYIPNYIIINENKYIYGGYFPSFYSTIDNSRNYTDNDLYILADKFEIEYKQFEKIDSAYNLYKECMNLLSHKSNEMNVQYPIKAIIEYNPPIKTLKKPTSFISYYIRPTSVKHIYTVYIDEYSIMYAAPFKYSDNNEPIYNSDFKNSNYYIEGPAIYEKSDKSTFIFSSMYIIVEYLKDSRIVKIREGINSKFVKKSPKQNFDSCNRFTDEINCNDEKSYSINGLKCKYFKNKCISITQDIDKIDNYISLKDIKFKLPSGKINIYKMKLWNEALEKSINYIMQKK